MLEFLLKRFVIVNIMFGWFRDFKKNKPQGTRINLKDNPNLIKELDENVANNLESKKKYLQNL